MCPLTSDGFLAGGVIPDHRNSYRRIPDNRVTDHRYGCVC